MQKNNKKTQNTFFPFLWVKIQLRLSFPTQYRPSTKTAHMWRHKQSSLFLPF